MHLEWDTLTQESLVAAIDKAMFDKEMRKKLEHISKLFHDQKDDPKDKVVIKYTNICHLI